MRKRVIRLLTLGAVSLVIGTVPARAQVTIELPQLVLEAKHTEYVYTNNPDTPEIINVSSSNPSVATAEVYRVKGVQIVAMAPGKTTVEFFDKAEHKLYRVLVWVTEPNATGGGGSGYNPRLTQLPEIVMLVKHTENAHTPDDKAARISGVKSSNPSVATARTDPPRGIQIYSFALGDTWIDFTDNATGTTYQVHVWVRDNLSGPDGSGGGGGGGKGGTAPNPKSKSLHGPRPGSLDKCLVGRWMLESSAFGRPTSGGTGAVVVIQSNGNLSADYNGMSKIVFSDGGSYHWTGTVSGHISAENGLLVADRIDRSNFNYDILDPHGKSMLSSGWAAGWSKTLGAIFPPSTQGRSISYTCSDSNLTIVQAFNNSRTTFVFKRRKQ
jgi:hypothetical protein